MRHVVHRLAVLNTVLLHGLSQLGVSLIKVLEACGELGDQLAEAVKLRVADDALAGGIGLITVKESTATALVSDASPATTVHCVGNLAG